jgi:hypothetical protein
VSDVDDPLKKLDDILKPDPRSTWRQIFDPVTGGLRQMTLDDHHALISEIVLFEEVPTGVRQLFETAKNLALYSWFECRFNQPAELWAYGALEMALREKAKSAAPQWWAGQTVNEREPPLGRLLSKAKSEQWVRNEGFELWRHHQKLAARQKAVNEIVQEMHKKNLKQAEIPDVDEFEGAIGDSNYDYVSVLESTMPYFRNLMAHGWPKIFPDSSPGTLRRCAEFINQLFQPQT